MAENSLLEKVLGLQEKYISLQEQLSDPAVISDMKKYVQLNKEYKELAPIIKAGNEYRKLLEDYDAAKSILAEEKDLVALPDELTYKDGAQVACGFGTVYEAIEKIGVSGNDAVLVTGLGPVGLAALMLAKAMGANMLIGVEMSEYRLGLAKDLGLADYLFTPDEAMDGIMKATNGHGVERAIDASASDPGRQLAIRATREWGKIAFVGEGGTCTFQPSPDIIHGQKTIYGSWVTSLWKMEELVERLVRWGIHPEKLITHEFPLEKAADAYALMAAGNCGKVAVVFD